MRVIIAGAGQVGTRVAAALDANHDVVMIDVNTDRIDRLRYDLDVLTVPGDSSAIETLREAGIKDADILIAYVFSPDEFRHCLVAGDQPGRYAPSAGIN